METDQILKPKIMDRTTQSINPTGQTYEPLNAAYEFFNKELFAGKLVNCLITFQRKGKASGYFAEERFQTRKNDPFNVHEIALNPSYFVGNSDAQILSTLVHEMVHLWQAENGTAPKRAYHNQEWASKMESVGLIPSNTGEPGGRKTGRSMSDYIQEGGVFDQLVKKFLETTQEPILYQDSPAFKLSRSTKRNKVKYTCSECGLNVWGKPNANIMCGDDEVRLEAVQV